MLCGSVVIGITGYLIPPIISADKWMNELLCGNLAKDPSVEVIGAIFQLCWAIWKMEKCLCI